MVIIEEDGSLLFRITLPEAREVLVVGAFSGWHEQQYPMMRQNDGAWVCAIDVGPGEYLFRYLVDQHHWILDDLTPATDPQPEWGKSRICRPLLYQTPDSLAA